MVAENIKAAARRTRMSLNRLADFSGLNRPHLLRVTSGKADATVGWLAQLADTLGIELRTLFDPDVLEAPAPPKKPKPASGRRSGKTAVRHR